MLANTETIAGTVCLVIGATSRVGLATSKHLSASGARVLMVDDAPPDGQEALSQVRLSAPESVATFVQADMALQRDVRSLVDRLMAEQMRLQVVVLCVDACFAQRMQTAEGIEKTLALNHLGPYLMLRLLVDMFRGSAPVRVIMLSSDVHRRGTIRYDDLQSEERYSALEAYAQAKLASLMTTYEFARRLRGTGVTFNAVNAGRHPCPEGKETSIPRRLLGLVAPSPEAVARTIVRIATSRDLAQTTGSHFSRHEPVRSSPLSLDTTEMRKVWQASADLTGLAVYP